MTSKDFVYEGVSASGQAIDACLLAVMIGKGRLARFPFFAALIAFDFFSGLIFAWAQGFHNNTFYAQVYVVAQAVGFVMQLLVIAEIARLVLRGVGAWRAEVLRRLYPAVAVFIIVTVGIIMLLKTDLHGLILFDYRAETFTDFVTCGSVISLMLAANAVGVGWSSHVIAVGQGLMLLDLGTATIEALPSFIGFQHPSLYYVRVVTYLVVVVYWIISLWRDEPALRPPSEYLKRCIGSLHTRVQADLADLG